MSAANPITRSTRQQTLVPAAGQTVFGPLGFKIYDGVDLRIESKATGDPDSAYTTITSGYIVDLPTAPDFPTVTFDAGRAATETLRFSGARTHERTVDVTLAGVIRAAPLERELDLQTILAQETRRDLDQLAAGLDAEEAARAAADAALQDNIDAEAAARVAGDLTLQANIDAEASSRAAEDGELQGNINAEAVLRAAGDATLQQNIDAEAATRAAEDGALQAQISSLSGAFEEHSGIVNPAYRRAFSYGTRAEVALVTVPAGIDLIQIERYDTASPWSPAHFRRDSAAGLPARAYATDAAGATFVHVGPVIMMETFGALGDDPASDTPAFQAAMQIPNALVRGRRDSVYYIGAGVSCAAGAFIRDAVLKVKLGVGGFTSQDISATDSRSTGKVLLQWNEVDGGGYDNLEIYGDGGGDYVCVPVVVNGGMATKTFMGRGRLYVHDLPGVAYKGGVVLLDKVGSGRTQGLPYDIDTIDISDIGTAIPATGWAGGETTMQVTGVRIDENAATVSARGRIKSIVGQNILLTGAAYAAHGQQTDLLTVAKSGAYGPAIDYVRGVNMGEVVDMFGDGAEIVRIDSERVEIAALKMGHGASRNRIGRVHGERSGLTLVYLFGTPNVGAGDTEHNVVGSVTGEAAGAYTLHNGTLASATETTAVLPTGASAVDDYYNTRWIMITGGTGASTTRVQITGYVGATRTITVASWPAGTPDATSTYKIYPFAAGYAVKLDSNTQGMPKHNTVHVDDVRNGGELTRIVASDLTDTTANNVVTINRDMGSTINAMSISADGPVRVLPGSALRAVTRMELSTNQVVATTAETLILFAASIADSYRRPDGSGQYAGADNGMRPRMSGPKKFTVSLRVSGAPAGATITVRLKREGTTYAERDFISDGAGVQTITLDLPIYHEETWISGNNNLWRVYVQHSDATETTYTASTVHTFFAVSD